MRPLFICYPAAAVACALRLLAACVAAASESRRDGKESRRDGRKGKEKQRRRIVSTSCQLFLYYQGCPIGGRVYGCAYLFRAHIQPLSGGTGLKSRAAKPFYIPLTFARAAIMGEGRGIGAEWGRQAGGGATTGTEKATSGGRKGEGARTTSPAPRARTSPERAHTEGD